MAEESWIAEACPVVRRIPAYGWLVLAMVRDPELPPAARALLVGSIGYNLAPVDLVPFVVPVFGQLDDLLVPLMLIRGALARCPARVKCRHLKAQGLTLANIDNDIRALRRAYRIAAAKTWAALAGAFRGRRARPAAL
jgi:uncharacterized membrane protein YkvA (DUF1232 family)